MSTIDSASGAATAGSSPVSIAAPSLTPNNNNELQVYFYASQAFAGPTITVSAFLNQRYNIKSTKEGFSLAFADLVAPVAHTSSPTYPATATISGGAAMSAQAILLISGSAVATPTSTATTIATRTPTPTAVSTTTSTPVQTPTTSPTRTPTATAATKTATSTPLATPTPASSMTFVGAGLLADSSVAVTTVTVFPPAGVQSGDILLAQIIIADGTGSNVPTPPTGWAAIRHDSIGDTNKLSSWLYGKVAASAEPVSYNWTISPQYAAGAIGAWRGASASPIDASSGARATGTTPISASAPSLTPTHTNELQVYFYAAQSFIAPTLGLPSMVTQRFNTRSSKEGFVLGIGDLAAPGAGTPSSPYVATATMSAGAKEVMTAQAVLLMPP